MAWWTLPQRRDHLARLRTETSAPTYPIMFQGIRQFLPLHRVPIDLPCYRLSNARTGPAQLEYIATHSLPSDFFSGDPDSREAVEAQHELLRQMVNEKKLLDVLQRHEQTEPLVVDVDGYVLNGNRRLCAMGLLLAQDPEEFEHFHHVEIAILPTCTEEDIEELEAQLQSVEDVRADYTWVAEALKRKSLRSRGWRDDRIAARYECQARDVQALIDMLDLADAYLRDRGRSGQYSHVVQQEYAFRELRKGRRQLATEGERDMFTCLSYVLLDVPGEAGTRLYQRIPALKKNLDEVADRLRGELPAAEVEAASNPDIDNLLGASDSDQEYAGLVRSVSDPQHHQSVRETIQDTLEEIDRRERERRDAAYCLRQITSAHTALQAALNALDEDATIEGIGAQLDNIDSIVPRIRQWLSEHGHD